MFVSSAKKNKYKKCKEPSKKAFFSFHNARRVLGCGGGGDANLVSRRAYSAPLLLSLPQSALLPSPICPPLRLFPFRSQIDDGASSTAPSPPRGLLVSPLLLLGALEYWRSIRLDMD